MRAFFTRLVGLFRDAGRLTFGGGVVGIGLNVAGIVIWVADLNFSALLVAAIGLGVLALTFLSVAYQAAKERDAARTAVKVVAQTAIEVSNSEGSSISNNHIIQSAAGGEEDPYKPRRRWFHRRLSKSERQDLAERCETCSRELMEMLHRPSPSFFHGFSAEERQAHLEAEEKHRKETERIFMAEFVVRLRDLLNEAAEAGYALDRPTAEFRAGTMAGWFHAQEMGEAVGVLGKRIGRKSKRL